MKYVEPKVFLIAETKLIREGVQEMLNHIGAPDWLYQQGFDTTDAELLVEIGGRLCYKSFGEGLNPNVTKVREGNKPYLGNIIEQRHGSVLEHSYATIVFCDVSRIETHEQVRHRAGTAYSQESGRYVRLTEFIMYRPDAIGEVLEEMGAGHEEVVLTYEDLENLMRQQERELKSFVEKLPWDQMDFSQKKRMTSALRRYAPAGTVNNIMVTANHRAWRYMIEQRTSAGAEEEIDKVYQEVAYQLAFRYSNLYQDMGLKDEKRFEHSKV